MCTFIEPNKHSRIAFVDENIDTVTSMVNTGALHIRQSDSREQEMTQNKYLKNFNTSWLMIKK